MHKLLLCIILLVVFSISLSYGADVEATNAAQIAAIQDILNGKQKKAAPKKVPTSRVPTPRVPVQPKKVIANNKVTMKAQKSTVRQSNQKGGSYRIDVEKVHRLRYSYSFLKKGCLDKVTTLRQEVVARRTRVRKTPLTKEMIAIKELIDHIEDKLSNKHHQKKHVMRLLNQLYRRLHREYDLLVFKMEASHLELADTIDNCVVSKKAKPAFTPLKPVRDLVDLSIMKGALGRIKKCRSLLPAVKAKIRAARLAMKKKNFPKQKAHLKRLIKFAKKNVHKRHHEKPAVLRLLESLLKQLLEEEKNDIANIEKMELEMDKQEEKCYPRIRDTSLASKAINLAVGTTVELYDQITQFTRCGVRNKSYGGKVKVIKKTTKKQKSLISRNKKTISTGNNSIKQNKKKIKSLKSSNKALKRKIGVDTRKISSMKADIKKYKGLYKSDKAKETQYAVKNQSLLKQQKKLKPTVKKLQREHNNAARELKKWRPARRKRRKRTKKPIRKAVKGSGARRQCWSTGDPHYMSFPYSSDRKRRTGRRRFDIYGWTGDFILAKVGDGKDFEVQTRIRYMGWGNRGLNRAVAVRFDGHIFESYGNYIKVDGKRLSLRVGRSKNYGRGAFVKRTGGRSYYVQSSSGAFCTMGAGPARNRRWYHNVSVYAPDSLQRLMTGICVAQHPTSSNKLRQLRLTSTDPRNMFGTKYVPRNMNHAVHKTHWPNAKLKRQAENHCHNKLKLKDDLYNDCLMDVKIFGSLAGAKTYENVNKEVKEVKAEIKGITKGVVGRSFRYVGRTVFSLGEVRKLRDDDVVNKLKKQLGANNKIAKDVESIVGTLFTELENARYIQQKLGKLVQKS